jgi:hypothetical protein
MALSGRNNRCGARRLFARCCRRSRRPRIVSLARRSQGSLRVLNLLLERQQERKFENVSRTPQTAMPARDRTRGTGTQACFLREAGGGRRRQREAHLEVLGSIAGELEDLSGEVFCGRERRQWGSEDGTHDEHLEENSVGCAHREINAERKGRKASPFPGDAREDSDAGTHRGWQLSTRRQCHRHVHRRQRGAVR